MGVGGSPDLTTYASLSSRFPVLGEGRLSETPGNSLLRGLTCAL